MNAIVVKGKSGQFTKFSGQTPPPPPLWNVFPHAYAHKYYCFAWDSYHSVTLEPLPCKFLKIEFNIGDVMVVVWKITFINLKSSGVARHLCSFLYAKYVVYIGATPLTQCHLNYSTCRRSSKITNLQSRALLSANRIASPTGESTFYSLCTPPVGQ